MPKEKSFYREQLEKAKGTSFGKDLARFLNDKGEPIGTTFSSTVTYQEAKKVKAPIPYFSSKKPSATVKKKCLHCQEEFKWDHKHSRREFDARRFCNNSCKRLYFSTPHETMQNMPKSNS